MRTLIVISSTLVVAACVAAGVRVADANADYARSTPAKAHVHGASPAAVSIAFTQQVRKTLGTYGIDVIAPSGATVTTDPATLDAADRSVISVPLQAALVPGRYVVRWKDVSDADGESAAGAFSFCVGGEPTAADVAADAELGAGEGGETSLSPETSTTVVTGTAVSSTPVSPTMAAGGEPFDDDDDGPSATFLLVIGGAVVAGTAVGLVAWRIVSGSRAR